MDDGDINGSPMEGTLTAGVQRIFHAIHADAISRERWNSFLDEEKQCCQVDGNNRVRN